MAGEERAGTIEKLMSISRAEFEAGLKRLIGTAPHPNGPDSYALPGIGADRQTVRCTFEPQPSAVLGTLLKLPRARITLDVAPLSSNDRTAFLTLFDRTFQRGGG